MGNSRAQEEEIGVENKIYEWEDITIRHLLIECHMADFAENEADLLIRTFRKTSLLWGACKAP